MTSHNGIGVSNNYSSSRGDATATDWMDHGGMTSPPLPPEIWNFSVIVAVSVIIAWIIRLVQRLFSFVDVRRAVNSDAILYLKDLGPSLHVLRSASMWHFQQLLRTTSEASSTPMKTVHVPFEVVTSSLQVERLGGGGGHHDSDEGSMMLSFRVRFEQPISVQVFWNVRCDAVDVGAASWRTTTSASRPNLPQILRRVSVDNTVRTLRSLPSRLSRVRRQRRRHELPDDAHIDGDHAPQNQAQRTGSVFGSGDYSICTPQLRPPQDGVMTVAIPSIAYASLHTELQSLIDEVDAHSPVAATPTRTSPVRSATPQYAAVVVIQVMPNESIPSSFVAKFGRQSEPTRVLCQAVALDLLPAPLPAARYSVAVIKKVSYTKTQAYISQEIYGRETASANSECTICLEGTRSVVLLPCRHLCVCNECLGEIDRCPICRAKFSTYVCIRDSQDGDACVPAALTPKGGGNSISSEVSSNSVISVN